MNFRQFYERCREPTNAIQFAIEFKLLPDDTPKKCTACQTDNAVTTQKRKAYKHLPFCLKCKTCKKETSLSNNSWFSHSHLSILDSLSLVYAWLGKEKILKTCGEIEVSANTVCDYYRFCREICYVVITNSKKKIGGEGHIVEVDETHLFTRKYNRGRFLKSEKEDTWIFGGIDRDTKELFALQVKSRNTPTLLSLIKEFILPGTKIFTDGWKSYRCLEKEGFLHGVVNHSLEFINSENRSIHTQTVERMWKTLKNDVKREGRLGEHDDLYIFEFLYRQTQRSKNNHFPHEMFIEFLHNISLVYPGYGKIGLIPKTYSGFSESTTSADNSQIAPIASTSCSTEMASTSTKM